MQDREAGPPRVEEKGTPVLAPPRESGGKERELLLGAARDPVGHRADDMKCLANGVGRILAAQGAGGEALLEPIQDGHLHHGLLRRMGVACTRRRIPAATASWLHSRDLSGRSRLRPSDAVGWFPCRPPRPAGARPGRPRRRLVGIDVVRGTVRSAIDSIAQGADAPRIEPRQPLAGGLCRSCHLVRSVEVLLRPICAADMPLEAEFVRHLSDDARYNRFMLAVRELSEARLRYLTDVDQLNHVALLAAVTGEAREVPVGFVRYIVDAAGTGCEFAIAVDDAWHGSGLAAILMHEIMAIARSRGIATMEGFMLASNARMMRFTRRLGFRHEYDPEDPRTVRVVREL